LDWKSAGKSDQSTGRKEEEERRRAAVTRSCLPQLLRDVSVRATRRQRAMIPPRESAGGGVDEDGKN
jgi:hypothetical protein